MWPDKWLWSRKERFVFLCSWGWGGELDLELGGPCLLWKMGNVRDRLESELHALGASVPGLESRLQVAVGVEGTPNPEGGTPSPAGRVLEQSGWRQVKRFLFSGLVFAEACPLSLRAPPLIVLVLEVASPLCDLQLSSSGSCTTMRDLDVPKETGFDFFSLDVMKRH